MAQVKKYRWLIILAVVIVPSFTFYWHEIRPVQARKQCTETTIYNIENNQELNARDDYTWIYQSCLSKKGIKE